MKVKEVLDSLIGEYDYDTRLYRAIVKNNIEFISLDSERRNLFGGKLIGCYYVKYTAYDKDLFYSNLFDLSYDVVVNEVNKISTIPKNFKVARDDINLVCFYIAHRFLTNKDLTKEQQFEYAKEILNYFNYRTLVLLSSNYFIYPISEEKAVTLIERLSNKYLIKKLKNWNEYCNYRSEEYLNSKFRDLLVKFNQDNDLPNAISDLYNRTKEAIKNIYRELLDMLEKDEIIRSNKSVIEDVEGELVLAEKIQTPETYIDRLESALVDKTIFIKPSYIDVTVSIIDSVSKKQLEELLNLIVDYIYIDKSKYNEVVTIFKDYIVNIIEYLRDKNKDIAASNDIIDIINTILGNLLYARGTDLTITKIKEKMDKEIKKIYKHFKVKFSNKTLNNIRNALFVYITLRTLIDSN